MPTGLFPTGLCLTAVLCLLLQAAHAAPTITVRATVSEDLRSISGTLHAKDLDSATWRDVLTDLPSGRGDLDAARMWPGRPNQGAVTWEQVGDTLIFEARIPHRRGDVGWTHTGLLANGGWYPVAIVDGALPLVAWDVEVELPVGVVGVVGDEAAPNRVRWQGTGERASLAALRRTHASRVHGEGYDLLLLTHGVTRPALRKTLPKQLDLMAVEGTTWRGVIVEAPLRTHLVRPGLGVAYLSDLAYEVFPGLARFHAEYVAAGLADAFTPSPDPLTRAVAGAAIGFRQRLAVGAELQRESLVGARWLSIVDNALLADDMRFKDAILQEPAPTRPLGDDLVERFRPHIPGGVAVGQVRARVGTFAAVELGTALAAGATLDDAVDAIGLIDDPIPGWRKGYPLQDYRVEVDRKGTSIFRDAPAHAPAEVVVVEIEGNRSLWEVPEGPAELRVEAEGVRRVEVDPEHMVGQTTRTNDQVPRPIYVIASVLLGRIDFIQEFVEADLSFTLRRSADTHNRFMLGAFSNQRDRIGVKTGWTGLLGPPTLRTVREHALGVHVEFSYLNPLFDRGTDARTSVGAGFTWDWDNRESVLFPRRGGSMRLTLSGGGAPLGGDAYIRATARATGAYAPHPRVVLGGRAVLGFAAADAPARRLIFGGNEGVRALPDQLVQPNAEGILSGEVRTVILDNAHVPLGVGTLTMLYAFAGVDLGAASVSGLPALAIGGTFGLGTVFSVLGVTPGAVNVTIGVPIATYGLDTTQSGFPITATASWGVAF